MTDTTVIAAIVNGIKEKLATYQAPDDSVLGMMPEETAELIRRFPGHLVTTVTVIEDTQLELNDAFRQLRASERQTEILQKAINKFATESGQGQIFLQNIQLCIDQVKRGT